ncbi:MAG: hypothetical protein ACRD3Q_19905 [Terriglobales bacterium]
MPTGNPVRLLALADREFRELTGRPVAIEPDRKFKPMKLNPSRFGKEWDRKRGAAVRLTAVLLREDDATLQARVCEDDKSVKTYANAAEWLRRESAHLRRVAGLLDTAGGRLTAVLTRCSGTAQP